MKKQILSVIIAGTVALSASSAAVLAADADDTAKTEITANDTQATREAADISAQTESGAESETDDGEPSAESEEAADVSVADTADEPLAVQAEEETEIVASSLTFGNFVYNLTGNGAQIVRYTGSEANVEIPSQIDETAVFSIAEEAFSGNKSIKSIIIPDTVTTVGEKAFSDCSSLETVKLSDNVQEIKENTFENCSSLTSINLPSNLVVIYASAFSDCASLAGISLPDSLQYIDEGAFYNCTSLNNVVLPKSVNNLNGSVFAGCTSLYELNVDEENPYYTSVGDIIYSKDLTSLVAFPGAHTGVYEVPEGTLSIGYGAFYKSNLEQITLPSTLKTIENAAFVKCGALSAIEIPSSVTYIGGFAFSGCSELKSVVIPVSVSKIDDCTFANCSALTRVVIPSSVTSFGEDVFSGCSQDCVIESNTNDSAAIKYAKSLGMRTSFFSYSEGGEVVDSETAGVNVVFNGEELELESPATIINDNTIIPMRALFEKMGAQVSWNEEDRTASAELNNVIVDIAIESNIMHRNGDAVTLEAPAIILNDFTYIPLRAVSEAFGAEVSWDGETRTAYVTFTLPEEHDHEEHDHEEHDEENYEEDVQRAELPVDNYIAPPPIIEEEYIEEITETEPQPELFEDDGNSLE